MPSGASTVLDNAEDAAFYGRFSSELQRDTSNDDQLQQCRVAAARFNCKIPAYLVFTDEAISGTSALNRKGLQKLLSVCKQGHAPFRVLFIADTSRLARNLEELLRICKILKFHGIELRVAATGLDSRTPGFEMLLTIAGLMDQEFVTGLKDKSRRGAIGSIERGNTPGGTCYGYRNIAIEDKTRKGLHGHDFVVGVYEEVVEEEAEVVRRIFRLYAEGWSYARIAKQFNAEGILSPQPSRCGLIRSWGHTGIREMLFNERYLGRRVWGKTTRVKNPETGGKVVRKTDPSTWATYENTELRIVSDELWAAVRTQNERKNEKTSAAAAGGMSRTAASRTYLFSGTLKCGLCGASIVIVGYSRGEPAYGCPYHRFRGG